MKKCFKIILSVIIPVVLIFISLSNLNAQKTAEYNNEAIANVGSENISYGELDKAFKKNVSRRDLELYQISQDSLYDFLNLYINFRLKVMDALSRGYDKDSSVLADIEQNRKVLAESYFYEKKLIEPNVERLLKLRDRELQISVIMFIFPSTNTDTLPTYEKAMKCLNLIKNGATFEQIAKDSSDDKESAARSGLIPNYITAGKIQKPIEEIIFRLKPGEYYPELIRTRYGYFLVKLIDLQPRIRVWGRHILLGSKEGDDTKLIKIKGDSLLALLKRGADFTKLAKEVSEDQATSSSGGSLGSYYSRSDGLESSGRHIFPEMEKALFALKDGEFSGLVKSQGGTYIIKRDSSSTFDPDSEKADMRMAYKRLYFEIDKKDFLDSLRLVYGFKINDAVMNEFLAALDTSKTNLDSAWASKISPELEKKNLLTIFGKNTTVGDFISMSNTKSELRGIAINETGINRVIDRIVKPLVFEEASKNLDKEYPDFHSLMKEFRDGILLFRVEEQEVWNKLKFDSVLAKRYWDTTKTRYWTDPTYEVHEIYVLSDSSAKDIYAKLKAGENFEELAANNTQRAGYREKKGNWGKSTEKTSKLTKLIQDKKITKPGLLEPMQFEKGFSIVYVDSYEPKRQKTFEEAISDFAPAFQDLMQKKLTEEWLNKVKEKFGVKIDKKKLDKIVNNLKKNKK